MRNVNSSSGIAEDMIRSFTQMACAEMHLKTLYEKTIAEMENGLVDMSDTNVRQKQIEKANQYIDDIDAIASLRRRMMVATFDLFEDGDRDVWCMVKHLCIANMCAWESWQASDRDEELLDIAIESNNLLTKYLTQFFGMEISPCAACLSDALKEGEINGVQKTSGNA